MTWSLALVVVTGRADDDAEITDEYVYTDRASRALGRGPECEIRIAGEQRKVSRRHCQVEVRPPHAYVRDLGSRNGTYVNDERLGEAFGERELKDGDELRIGETTVRIALGTDDRTELQPGLRTLRELGRGAQGVVHLARHTASGRLVAAKTLTHDGHLDPAARDAFLRELDCTKALRHPHIVRYHGSAAHDGTVCFTCEYCAGGSVADLVLRQGGRLAVDEAVPLVLQALDGLAYAHEAEIPVRLADGQLAAGRGLVHRDVKPQNLLLTGTGRERVLKIADFGLAKAFDKAGLSGRTRTGAIGGSLAFMPRRQLIDYKYARPDVDLWAVTASLYWMLTGALPRDFPPDADPVDVVRDKPPVPVRERLPSIPRQLAEVIDAGLDQVTDTAPASASVLSRRLRQAL
ncbi:FHA domain-containing serine/threonine-protein kinase [Streptomyces sp. NBC_01613]|uniref:protein kinase domain-containing protein n=1 Tax=Streptomyces sp. NBC_01613 TaxID=2975896 RepID=UPI003868A3DC